MLERMLLFIHDGNTHPSCISFTRILYLFLRPFKSQVMPAQDTDTHLVWDAVSNYHAFFNSMYESGGERVQIFNLSAGQWNEKWDQTCWNVDYHYNESV